MCGSFFSVSCRALPSFCPSAPTADLVVAEELFAWLAPSSGLPAADLLVTVVLHLGTLLAILLVYWPRVWQLLVSDRRVIGLLVVGTIPAALVGLVLEKYFESYLLSPVLTGCMLPINGAILFWVSTAPPARWTTRT